MRWNDGGDDGADDVDGVDDDPDDARRDGDDDDGDCHLREGNSPADFSQPELFFSLSGFRLVEVAEKFLFDTPDVFRSRVSNKLKGNRRGAIGIRGGSHPQPRVDPRQGVAPAPWSSSPCALLAPWLISQNIILRIFLEFSELRTSGILTGTFPADSGLRQMYLQ